MTSVFPNDGRATPVLASLTRTAVPAVVMLGYWFLLQLLGAIPNLEGEGAGVAFWAHIGGFVAGIVLLPLFRNRERVAAHRLALGLS